MTFAEKNTIEKNIVNLFGKKGQDWLQSLPIITKKLSQIWSLSDLHPVSNMSYNYVMKAIKDHRVPVVIKISCDQQLIADEIKALQYFHGHGSIELLDINSQYNALLLEQAIPGDSLKSLYPEQAESVIDYYSEVIQRLISVSQTKDNKFRNIRDWLTVIERVDSKIIPPHLLNKAIELKNYLLKTSAREYVLHGDLHHDNILKQGSRWLAIDPKGIVGEIAFEAAAFDFIHESEFSNNQNIQLLFGQRVAALANKLELDPRRLAEWVFVRLILAAAWFIEDNGDPCWPITMANEIYQILNQ